VLFRDVATASQALAAASSRREKVSLVAQALRAASPAEVPAVVAWLSGGTRQRRTGLGWASLRDLPGPCDTSTLTVRQVDDAFERASELSGPGSQTARLTLLAGLLSSATGTERRLLAGLVAGEVRHGAQAGVMLDAIASAAGVPAADVRRAVTLAGDPGDVAVAVLAGGPGAQAGFGLRVGRALAPMLAGTAPDLDAALDRVGPSAAEWKLDGVRVQVHRDGDDIAVFTRTLDDVTARVPEVVEAARSLPVRTAVLDGETLVQAADGRPAPFQVTSSRVARRDVDQARRRFALATVLFDVLHLDGADLLDEPGALRRSTLEAVAPAGLVVPRCVVDDPGDPAARQAATAFAADALARGHEGVVVKSLAAGYAMGRRGAGWVKVKPRLTLDLVVLAAEWGHGRRQGRLSNLHLGARDPDGRYGAPGGFVMLGKTFKGLTDAMLAWQTDHLQALATGGTRWQVDVRPELVVEVAFDGVQTSSRYPAGMALRFARVLAHRPDKPAAQADTVSTVRALHAGRAERQV
jgi:DNA ligase-1